MGIGLQAVSLSPCHAGLAEPRCKRLLPFPALSACSCSLTLSGSGEPLTLARLSGNRLLSQDGDGAKSLILPDLGFFCPLRRCIHNPSDALFLIFQGLTLFLTPCIDNLWQAFRKSNLVDTPTPAAWSRAASMANRGLSLCFISAQRTSSSTGSCPSPNRGAHSAPTSMAMWPR